MRLRILSYNIHGGIGRSGTIDPEAIVAVIRAADADVVALQEVHTDDDADRSFLRNLDTLDYGCQLEGPTMRVPGGQFGNLLLARLPLIEDSRLDLSVGEQEPRGAIRARFQAGAHNIEVIATHLGLGLRERRIQVARLVAALPDWHRHPPDVVRVGLGDFNEWLPWGRTRRRLHRLFGEAPRVGTFPLWWPLLALDRVFVRPREALLTLERFREPPASHASDHWPLLATVAFPEQSTEQL